MTKPDKKLELLQPEGIVVHTTSRQAYLLTFYTAHGKRVVLLQASHDPICLQFATFEQAMAYLENQTSLSQSQKEEP